MSNPGKSIRRNASPSTKQGPIRATVQFGLVQGSPSRNVKPKSSPSSSPIPPKAFEHGGRKGRSVSESRLSPERRSPVSSGSYKVEKPKAVRTSPNIKRSGSLEGSLEALAGNSYLSGQWPRDLGNSVVLQFEKTTSDRGTQTDDWEDVKQRKKQQRLPTASSAGDVKDMYKAFRRHKAGSSSGYSRQSPVQGNHSAFKTSSGPMRIPVPKLRRSVEALNQEVEKLIVSGKNNDRERASDGHKAPILELLSTSTPSTRRRDMNTQTPKTEEDMGASGHMSCNSLGSGGGGSRSHSVSPAGAAGLGPFDSSSRDMVEGRLDVKFDKEVETGSPEDNLSKIISGSPKPNNSFVREPPDGCEIIKIVGTESSRKLMPPPVKECLLEINAVGVGEFKQSERSAFCPPSASLSPSAFLQGSVH